MVMIIFLQTSDIATRADRVCRQTNEFRWLRRTKRESYAFHRRVAVGGGSHGGKQLGVHVPMVKKPCSKDPDVSSLMVSTMSLPAMFSYSSKMALNCGNERVARTELKVDSSVPHWPSPGDIKKKKNAPKRCRRRTREETCIIILWNRGKTIKYWKSQLVNAPASIKAWASATAALRSTSTSSSRLAWNDTFYNITQIYTVYLLTYTLYNV